MAQDLFSFTSIPMKLHPFTLLSPSISFLYAFLPNHELLHLPLWELYLAQLRWQPHQRANISIYARKNMGTCILRGWKNRKSSFTYFRLQFHNYFLWRNLKAVAGHILGKWSYRNPSLQQQRLLHKDNSMAYMTLESSEKPWQGFHSIFEEQKDYTWDHFILYPSPFFWVFKQPT